MITLDYETRSACDLKKAGAYRYAIDPTTSVLCLAWKFPEDDGVHLWHPAYPDAYTGKKAAPLREHNPAGLEQLFDRIADGELVEAHNAFFERVIWRHVCVERMGWPDVPEESWRCSAAKAAAHAMPRKLEWLAKALGLGIEKDMEGNRLMMKLAKPRRPKLAELRAAGYDVPPKDKAAAEAARIQFQQEHGHLWHEDVDELRRLFDYCRQDVAVEEACSSQLRELSPAELKVWQVDQRINLRGVHIDREGAAKALALTAEQAKRADEEMAQLSDGDVPGCTKREVFRKWVVSQGLDLPNTQAETIDALVAENRAAPIMLRHIARALELWRMVNRTSTAKYRAMLTRICPDDRVRDLLLYHGASTGRWSGRGIQPQNFPRGSIDDMAAAWEDIREFDLDVLLALYGDVMELLSSALRGAICAAPGRVLIASDYSAIEARGTFWVAGCEKGIQAFRDIDAGLMPGQDIYTIFASEVLGRQITKADKFERQTTGKPGILGCGYQMGGPKLVDYSASMSIELTEDQADDIVAGYRSTYPEVVQLWRDMNDAAILATKRGPGAKVVKCGPTRWAVRGRFLHCRLPNGRLLSYYLPRVSRKVVKVPARRGRDAYEFEAEHLSYMGMDSFTHQWRRIGTYGGKLVENVVQALCRDLMAEAMVRIDSHGAYDIVLSVHDELVAEVDEGVGDLDEFNALMEASEPWAHTMPVKAEGWTGRRYRKD